MADLQQQPTSSWDDIVPVEPTGRSPLRIMDEEEDVADDDRVRQVEPALSLDPAGRSPLRREEDIDDEEGDTCVDATGLRAVAPQQQVARRPESDIAAVDSVAPAEEEEACDQVSQADNNLKSPQEEEEQQQQQREDEQQEEQEEMYHDDPFSLHPDMLVLTEQERVWAMQVRDAIDGLTDLDFKVSDFMCAHLAIASRADIEWVVERVYKMQEVRREYKILGTYQEGCAAIRGLFDLLPGGVIHFSCDPATGDVLVIFNFVSNIKELWRQNYKNIDTTIRGSFYLCHAEFPSLECVRVGNVHVFEAEGYEWGKGMGDIKEFSQLTNETVGTFPVVLQATRLFNTPTLVNCIVSMAKKLIPEDIACSMTVGHRFSGGTTLRDLYLVPAPKDARERAYRKICRSLKLRFEAEEAFSL